MAEEEKTQRFGDICVEKGYITPEQLNAVLEDQRVLAGRGIHQTIGDILVAKSLISAQKRNEILRQIKLQSGEANLVAEFDVVSKLGAGGMGVVYAAKSCETGEKVALKVLPPELARDQSYVDRFLREVEVMQTLDHPNIVSCVDFGFDEKRKIYYCAMEYVDGRSIDEIIEKEGMIDERRALDIVFQMAQALQHSYHLGLIHRDIKPSNIMVTKDGIAKLLDLGLARDKKDTDAHLTMTGVFVGSPYYASPEQARGDANLDIRTDIYSLGATLYHMVTGETPFNANSPAEVLVKHMNDELPWPGNVNPDLSDSICRLIEKMMAKDPKDRYNTPKELLNDVMSLIAGKALAVESLAPGRSTVNRQKQGRILRRRTKGKTTNLGKSIPSRNQSVAYAVLIPVAVLLGVGAYFIMQNMGGNTYTPPASIRVKQPPGVQQPVSGTSTVAPNTDTQHRITPVERPLQLVYENSFENTGDFTLEGWTTAPQANTGQRAIRAMGEGRLILKPEENVGPTFTLALAYSAFRSIPLNITITTNEGTISTGDVYVSAGDWQPTVWESAAFKGKGGRVVKTIEIRSESPPDAGLTIDDVRLYAGMGREKVLASYTQQAPPLTTVQTKGDWRAIFDGKTLNCLSGRGYDAWVVKDGAITNVLDKNNDAQTAEAFVDGEIRIRFECTTFKNLKFAVRQAQGRTVAAFDTGHSKAMENRRHELVFTCRGNDVEAVLDNIMWTVTAEGTQEKSGRVQFNIWGGMLKVFAIDYRPLPQSPAATPPVSPIVQSSTSSTLTSWDFEKGAGGWRTDVAEIVALENGNHVLSAKPASGNAYCSRRLLNEDNQARRLPIFVCEEELRVEFDYYVSALPNGGRFWVAFWGAVGEGANYQAELRVETGKWAHLSIDPTGTQVFSDSRMYLKPGDPVTAMKISAGAPKTDITLMIDNVRIVKISPVTVTPAPPTVTQPVTTPPATRPEPRKLSPEELNQKLNTMLTECDDRLEKGEYFEARTALDAAVNDTMLAPIADDLKAAASVARSLCDRIVRIQAVLKNFHGQDMTFKTNQGQVKGSLVKTSDEGIVMAVTMTDADGSIYHKPTTIAWPELTWEEKNKYAGMWKPEGADGAIARAYVAVGLGDMSGAEKLMTNAKQHPLTLFVRRRLDALKPAPTAAPSVSVTPPAVKKPWPPDISTARTLFKGEVRKFDPEKFYIELSYDFNNAEQMKDWIPSQWASAGGTGGKIQIENGMLKLAGTGRCVLHVGKYLSADIRASFVAVPKAPANVAIVACADGQGNFYTLHALWKGRYTRIEKVTAGKQELLEAVENSPFRDINKGYAQLSAKAGHLYGDAGGRSFQTDDKTYLTGQVGFWADSTDVSFDNAYISATLDQNWLAEAMVRAGLIARDDLPSTLK